MMFRRAIVILLLLSASIALRDLAASTQQSNADVLAFLNETVDWYRRLEGLVPSTGDSQELLLRSTVMQDARQIVQMSDSGSAQASMSDGSAGSSRSKGLAESATAAAKRAARSGAAG